MTTVPDTARVDVEDVMAVLEAAGHTEPLISEGEASRIARGYGFVRNPGSNPRKMIFITDLAADLARRLNEAAR